MSSPKIMILDDLELIHENALRIVGGRLTDAHYNIVVDIANSADRLVAMLAPKAANAATLAIYEAMAKRMAAMLATIDPALTRQG